MSNNNMNKDTRADDGVLPTENTTHAANQGSVTSKMQDVKSAWDKAPEGQKKATALKHYQSAEKAQKSGNEAEARRELEEAARALK